MINKIELTKTLPREQWGEFFDQFTNSNQGRHISIESISPEFGDEVLIQNAPLMAIVYDRPGKGNDLIIEIGKDEVTYAHTIDEPVEVLTGQDSNGKMIVLSIADTAEIKTLIQLKAT
jgi:hypothetical protein